MDKRLQRLSRITFFLFCIALALVGLSFGSGSLVTIDTSAQGTQKPAEAATANQRADTKATGGSPAGKYCRSHHGARRPGDD